jgi:U3 small nucleolar RNA-associated protein 10
VLPAAIPTALEYLAVSLHEASEDEILHNAGYAFISSLIQYLPYMITGSHLERLLAISNLSAEAEFDKESDGARTGCLRLAAKVVEAKIMITAMEHNFGSASEAGNLVRISRLSSYGHTNVSQALREYLEVLGVVIEKHPKSTITKNSTLLSAIFLKAFDLRRQRASSDAGLEDIDDIEDIINAIAIQMIYKFNDSTFRPIFANVMEWASSGLPRKDSQGRMLRLQSVYSFLAAFFGNLKSIVTSYASYVLENAVDILKNVDPTDEVSCELWNKVLLTLMQCFRHDQDDFWQAPAHFDLIGPAILHSISLPLVENSVLAIVELATVADSTDHHKELNMSILKNMRSENAGVRLAAVRCEQALTDRLGEEWLSMLPEMLPFISELQEDDDDVVERETHRWIIKIEGVLGESLDSMLH